MLRNMPTTELTSSRAVTQAAHRLTISLARHKLHVDLIISALHPVLILLPVNICRVEYYLKEQTGLCART